MSDEQADPAANPENTAPATGGDAAANNGGGTIDIVLSHGGVQVSVEVPAGTDLGHIRSLDAELDEIGAPSNYNLGVNGVGQDDSRILEPQDVISFRPIQGNKGRR